MSSFGLTPESAAKCRACKQKTWWVVEDVVEQYRSGALSKERSVVVGDVVEQDRSGALSKERSVVVGDVVEQEIIAEWWL